MKANQFCVVAAFAAALSAATSFAATFSNNTLLAAGDLTYDGQDIVVSACTLAVNGPHSFHSLLVTNGGVVTHSPAPNGEANNRLNLMIAQDAIVDAASRISTAGCGYRYLRGPGAPPGPYGGGEGAGYGGEGGLAGLGQSGRSYGSVTQPSEPGSGGYGWGQGGGAIRLVVNGTLFLNGTLNANGTDGGGGSSGGSIFLSVGTLAGLGAISANGGVGIYQVRSGGGPAKKAEESDCLPPAPE